MHFLNLQLRPDLLQTEKQFKMLHIFEECGRFLLILNNCCNFLVYMTGRQFRKGCHYIIKRIRDKLRRAVHLQWSENRWFRHPPDNKRYHGCFGSNSFKLFRLTVTSRDIEYGNPAAPYTPRAIAVQPHFS